MATRTRAASEASRQAWAAENGALALRFAAHASAVRAHSATLNRYLAAAPEARKALKGLPWAPPAEEMPPPAPPRNFCSACGAPVQGPFCGQCGARA